MGGVLQGFAIIAVLVVVGYVLARNDVLGDGARLVLNRFVFFVASPCLLFTVLAEARPAVLFSTLLVVSATAAAVVAAAYALVARFAWRRTLGPVTIGALSAGYVNSNNIGLPVATYVLGDPAYSAPIILLQLVLFAPVALVALDAATREGRRSLGGTLLTSLRNPLIVGSVLGLLVAVSGLTIAPVVIEPLRLLGGAAIPLMLTGFGMSLFGSRPLGTIGERRDVLLAAGLKLAAMPLVAYVLGAVFGLGDRELYAVVVLAALPTAQNVLTFATRYNTGVVVARDAGLLTTAGSLPVLLLVSAVLA